MKLKHALAILLFFVCNAAFAQAYIYGAIGQTSVGIDKAALDDAIGSTSSSVDDKGTGFKIAGGWRLHRNFAAEVGYTDLGKASYTSSAPEARADFKASGVTAAAVGILPLNDKFSLLAKIGLMNAKVKLEGAGGSATDTSLKNTYGFGATYAFTQKLGVRAEYERFAKLGNRDKTGEADVDLISVGVTYRF